MSCKPLPRFEDWEAKKMADEAFAAAAAELEPGYQVARLRIQRGLTQTQLAEKVGTRQPSIGGWKMARQRKASPFSTELLPRWMRKSKSG